MITVTQIVSYAFIKPFSFILQLALVNMLSKKINSKNKTVSIAATSLLIFIFTNVFLYFFYNLLAGTFYDGPLSLGFPLKYHQVSCGLHIYGFYYWGECQDIGFRYISFFLDILIWVVSITSVLTIVNKIKNRKP